MPIRHARVALVCAALLTCLNFESNLMADEPVVRFDVPALTCVREIEFDQPENYRSRDSSDD
jgi:hypothetical protein